MGTEAILFKCMPLRVVSRGLLCIWTFKTSSLHTSYKDTGWTLENCSQKVKQNHP